MRIGTPGEKSHRKVEGVGGEESIFLVSKCFRKHFPFLRFFLSLDRIRIPRIETIIRGRKYVESVVVVRRTGLYRFRYGCLYYDRFAWRVAKLRVLDRQEGRGRRGGAIIWSTWFDSAREGFLKVGSGSRSLVTTSGGGGGENFSVGVISKRKISRGIERNERVKRNEERKKVD